MQIDGKCVITSSDKQLLEEPHQYQNIANNRLLAKDKCFYWIMEGLYHCLLTFFAFYFYWTHGNTIQPQNSLEMLCFGIAVYTVHVVLVNLRLLLHAKYWNLILVISVFLSILAYLGFT